MGAKRQETGSSTSAGGTRTGKRSAGGGAAAGPRGERNRSAGNDARPLEGSPTGSWTHTLAEVALQLGVDDELPCGACGHRGRGRRVLLHLTHGVSVWLCDVHSDECYLRRDNGWVFAQRVARAWAAVGALSARRAAALSAHVRLMSRLVDPSVLPGSYAWPELRREAEERYARGDDPAEVIVELRGRYAAGPFRPPSVRTMRRWFTDARWIRASSRPVRGIRKWWEDRSWVPWQFILLPKPMLDVLPMLYSGIGPRSP